MPRRLISLTLFTLGAAACGGNHSVSVAPAESPAPIVAADSAVSPDAAGARWFGYEGGLKDAESSARSIEGAVQYWTRSEGQWSADSAAGKFTAFNDGKWVRRLEITADSGRRRGGGAFTYDERGRLYYFGGEWRVRVGKGKRARTDRVIVSVALNSAGSVGAARKTLNGRAQALSAAEVAWILVVEQAARTAAGDGER